MIEITESQHSMPHYHYGKVHVCTQTIGWTSPLTVIDFTIFWNLDSIKCLLMAQFSKVKVLQKVYKELYRTIDKY